MITSRNKPATIKKETVTASNCIDLIRNQIATVQTFPHPSASGKQHADYLADLLLEARAYFPSSKTQFDAFSGRIRGVYEDEGLLLMALMDLHKWIGSLHNPEVS